MEPHQRFLYNDKEQAIQIRRDSRRGYFYSRMNDIQSIFQGAAQFKVDGTNILFLKNEQGDLIEPKRIAHYPDRIVEVVTVAQEPIISTSLTNPADRIVLPTTKSRSPEIADLDTNSPTKLWSLVDSIENSVPALDVVQASTVSIQHETNTNTISEPDSTDLNTTSAGSADSFDTTSNESKGSEKTNVVPGVKPKYYVPPLHSFVQMVRAKGGMWDPELKKATITLKTEYITTNFFVKLLSQGTEVQDLNLTLEWDYQKSDLTSLVNQVALSNVQFLRLDMKGEGSNARNEKEAEQSGGDEYQPLLDLFSNPKLENISFANVSHFGSRTTGLCTRRSLSSQPALQSPITLQSFHFIGVIHVTDDALLESILHLCPRLVDVRLGSFSSASEHSPKVEGAIQSLRELQSLHLYNLSANLSAKDGYVVDQSSRKQEIISPLKSIFSVGIHFGHHPLQDVVQQSSPTIEVLILRYGDRENQPIALMPQPQTISATPSQDTQLSSTITGSINHPFCRLTHLDLAVKLTTDSHTQLASILPGLDLTHFGADAHTKDLVKSVNFASLRSIWLFDMDETFIQPLFDAFLGKAKPCKINTMRFGKIRNIRRLPDFLSVVSLKRLYLSLLGRDALKGIFGSMELADLQVLAVFDDKYDWTVETTLARRSHLFSEKMVFQLGYFNDVSKRDVHNPKSRQVKPTVNRLSCYRLQIMSSHRMYEEFMHSILPGRLGEN
ncbi:hypothetical protein EC991_002917 [Linnemannia zychae]|nr:hypothetical protein EC991_002917 [Linnemannia zychae]